MPLAASLQSRPVKPLFPTMSCLRNVNAVLDGTGPNPYYA